PYGARSGGGTKPELQLHRPKSVRYTRSPTDTSRAWRIPSSEWPLTLIVCPGELLYLVSTPAAFLPVMKYSIPAPAVVATELETALMESPAPRGLRSLNSAWPTPPPPMRWGAARL